MRYFKQKMHSPLFSIPYYLSYMFEPFIRIVRYPNKVINSTMLLKQL